MSAFDARAAAERLAVASAVADCLDATGEFEGPAGELWAMVTTQTPSAKRAVGYAAGDFLPVLREAAGDLSMRGWQFEEFADEGDEGTLTLRLRRVSQ